MKCTHTSPVLLALHMAMVRAGNLGSVKSVRRYVKHLRQGMKDLLLCAELQNTSNSISPSLSFFI